MKKIFQFLFLAGLFVLQTSLLRAQITVTSSTNSIGAYDVYELTIQHPQSYPNNWEDVTVSAVFSGPQTMNISGFFYNTNVWKVRFAPPLAGNWTYAITFKTPSNTFTANGSFTCVASTTKGFLKRHPNNPFRLIYPDGTLFNGIGIGDCINDGDKTGTPHDNWGFDGDFRPTGQEAGTDTTLDVYMKAYGGKGAGFNMFRWSINNCAFNMFQNISTTGNTYLVTEGRWGDSLVQSLRQNDIRLWLTFFSWNTPFHSSNVVQPAEEAAVNRYIKYIVARYGAYADIWELNNETTVSDRWLEFTTTYLRSIDPYNRLISASWARPSSPFIDINSPHWYETESELSSDRRSWEMIRDQKPSNKLIIFGEQGGSVSNWDSLSALRMRLRSWTAFFAEGMLIFWNGSWAKDYYPTNGAANLYLGPIERGYIRVMQNFTALADTAIRQMTITPSNTSEVRAYGLQSPKIIMGYFHHYSSHTSSTATTVSVAVPQAGTIYWINPANDSLIQSAPIAIGSQTITSPVFKIDLAMRISLGTSPGGKACVIAIPSSLFSGVTLPNNGSDSTLCVKVVNCGDTASVYTPTISGVAKVDYSFKPAYSGLIQKKDTAIFCINYKPSTIAVSNASFNVASSDKSSVSVQLAGTDACATPIPQKFNIPNTGVGAKQQFQIQINNTGGFGWTQGTGDIQPGGTAFKIDSIVPLIIPPGGNGIVYVTFAPTASGVATAKLTFPNAGPCQTVVLNIDLNGSGIVNSVKDIDAKGFVLEQSYPNPTQGKANFIYIIPRETGVRITLVDLTGKLVRTLITGHISQGEHTVSFDASNVPRGTYMYMLESGSTKLLRRLILTR